MGSADLDWSSIQNKGLKYLIFGRFLFLSTNLGTSLFPALWTAMCFLELSAQASMYEGSVSTSFLDGKVPPPVSPSYHVTFWIVWLRHCNWHTVTFLVSFEIIPPILLCPTAFQFLPPSKSWSDFCQNRLGWIF